jgi:hypothetical protein
VARADLHIHTRHSDGFATGPQVLEHVEREAALAVVAITDHEDVTSSLRAREIAAQRGYRVEVVPGAEVTTRQGHLVALFVERTPPLFRSLEATLADIHAQGGVAIVPHPLSWLTRSISRRSIDRVLETGEVGIHFDGIETANPSPAGRVTRERVAAANTAWGLTAIGASDAHHLEHVGSGWTEFEGTTAEDLRAAILAGRTRAGAGHYRSPREIGVGRSLLGLAWGFTATPRRVAVAAAAARTAPDKRGAR